jgi:hypothetical protein
VKRRWLAGGAGVAACLSAACSSGTPADDPATKQGPDGGPGVVAPPACAVGVIPRSFEVFKLADAAPRGARPVIAMGINSAPIVAFLVGAAGQEQIVAARLDDAAGMSPAVAIVPMSLAGPTSTPPRMAVAGDGRVAIAYLASSADGASYRARYSEWSGRSDDPARDIEPVSDPIGSTTPEITFDRGGRPVLALAFGDESLRLLSSPAEGSWSRHTVDIGVLPFETTHIEMGLDAGGQAILVGTRTRTMSYDNDLMLLPSTSGSTVWRRDGLGWVKDRFADYSLGPRVRLSPAGELTILVSGTGGIARIVRRGSDWSVEDPVADAAGHSPQGDMADAGFGPNGELHAILLDENGMKHAVLSGCQWSEAPIDVHGQEPSMTVDAAGRVHVAYQKQMGLIDIDGAPISEVWYARSSP